MKEIKIKKIKMQNFKGIKDFEVLLDGKRTYISGRNGVGKTTIADAVNWVLFNKMADGSSPDKIRPHDENGKDIDYIEIMATVVLTVNDVTMEIKKTQKQNWIKPRGMLEAEFRGNVNEYEVNGIPLTEKMFKEKIGEIVNEEIFRYASNIGAFLSVDYKKRRVKLFELTTNVGNLKIVNENPELAPLSDSFRAKYTYEELVSLYGKAAKEKKKELADIPVRIDEISKTLVEGNLSELKNQADELRANIAKSDNSRIEADISELNAQKASLILSEKTRVLAIKNTVESKISEAIVRVSETESEFARTKSSIESLESHKELLEDSLEATRKVYREKMESEFEGDTNCPVCGQKLPKTKVEKAMAKFEEEKKNELDRLTKKGTELKTAIAETKESLAISKKKLEEFRIRRSEAEKMLQNAKSEIPIFDERDVDTSEIDRQIEEKKKLLKIDDEIGFAEKLKEVNKQILLIEQNEIKRARIDELTEKQKELSQAIAECERKLYLLEIFNKKKAEMLTDEINNHFNFVKWVLFETQINGGVKEVCEATLDGSIVGNGLNHGHSVLAGIDICATMQKIYDIDLPIFVDNAESLSYETMRTISEKTNSQMIFLQVAESDLEVKRNG